VSSCDGSFVEAIEGGADAVVGARPRTAFHADARDGAAGSGSMSAGRISRPQSTDFMVGAP